MDIPVNPDELPCAFIAGDWGTSNLRLALCDARGNPLETRRGPGAADARGHFAEIFDAETAKWREAHGELPAVLSGMVGSTIGWVEASYLTCPVALEDLALQPLRVRDGVSIVPGMRCRNLLNAPDFMRGEETQLLGACLIHPSLREGKQLVCMPGTHTKWVALQEGVVEQFLTVPSGEVFSLLCEHSVLVRDESTPIVHLAAEFQRGLDEASRLPSVPLLHRMFQSRSLRLDKQLSAEGAASWMSGLLIGTDVGGALAQFADHDARAPVYVIGAPQLMDAYSHALAHRARSCIRIDGNEAALSGLAYVYRVQERERS